MTWLTAALTGIAILIFSGFCQNALVEFNDSKLKRLCENKNNAKNKKATRLYKLQEKSNRLILSEYTLKVFLTAFSVSSAEIFSFEKLKGYFNSKNFLPERLCTIISMLIPVILTAVIVVTFGVKLPKKICSADKYRETYDNFILNFCGIYKFILTLFLPIVVISEVISKITAKISGIKSTGNDDDVTEEEILMMVDAVNENGSIEESQAEMINNIFLFDDIEASEIMTHRTELVSVSCNDDILQAVKLVIDEGVSRIPVYNETIDDICGVIFAKDLLELALDDSKKNSKVKDFMHEIRFVPESSNCRELFDEFTRQKVQIAVVVDEYGGTAGIVTMEDLLECIVGNIRDEYDDEEEEIQEITPNTFDFLGSASFSKAAEAMGFDIKNLNGDYDTVGGFVIDKLGYIPKKGSRPTFKWKNVTFEVISADNMKIEKIRARFT